ncbi:MAG: aspartate aminotransferase, partial [Acidimicrobiales bacterium]|nr:aspartate aminotransferase [Acidimicrobiales bacterium]
ESPEQLGYDTIANNLSESSVADRRLSDFGLDLDLDDLLLCYGDHLGDPALRAAVVAADDSGRTSATGPGGRIQPDDVLVTPGAAAALFCVATALLEPGDHVVVVRTNYATNLETPRAIGADLDVVDLAFDDGWRLDVDRVAACLRPGITRLISVTCPHNPTGTMLDLEQLDALVALAEQSGAVLLVDETYRDLTHGQRLPLAATRSPRAISVSSMSKAYGLPGLRVGWAVTRDPGLAELLLAAKEQVLICGATLDEAIAGAVLADRERILPPILDGVRAHLAIVREWMAAQDAYEWVEPSGGVVGLVRLKPEVELDAQAFHRTLLAEPGTYVGPGHWFELDDRYLRLGYGWPTTDQLRAGLAGLSAAAGASAHAAL